MWRKSFSKNKVVLKKPQHMREGKKFEKKSPFEKKNKLVEIIFPESFPHPGKYSYYIPHEYWAEPTKKEIIKLCLCHTIFINF